MINQVYQLVAPRQFDVTYNNVDIYGNHVIVRPLYLSICAADQRYYTGRRDENVLRKKLPMSLVHEAVGEVVFDSKGVFEKGTKVVMVPNTPTEQHHIIAENYLASSYFRSSGYDGFMQDYVVMAHDRIVPLPNDIDLSTISYTELVSVSFHAIQRFERKSIPLKTSFGIWGDGNLGYITAILLRKLYPEAKIYVFECVGGKGSQVALQQIVEHISPEGSIALLGVSELPVEVNTRLVLEKGLTLIGSSRSGSKDFEQVVDLYRKYPDIVEKLALLKGHEINVCTMQDIVQAFEMDLSTSWGKTVLKWTI
ncbi:TPA: alcohol dehydrogenase catalytic domain-containing protein [Staphylococcus aureus]|nr:alcohol dehydrogenase catalytic domain-containing protein [Staphylococcus aureus]